MFIYSAKNRLTVVMPKNLDNVGTVYDSSFYQRLKPHLWFTNPYGFVLSDDPCMLPRQFNNIKDRWVVKSEDFNVVGTIHRRGEDSLFTLLFANDIANGKNKWAQVQVANLRMYPTFITGAPRPAARELDVDFLSTLTHEEACNIIKDILKRTIYGSSGIILYHTTIDKFFECLEISGELFGSVKDLPDHFSDVLEELGGSVSVSKYPSYEKVTEIKQQIDDRWEVEVFEEFTFTDMTAEDLPVFNVSNVCDGASSPSIF